MCSKKNLKKSTNNQLFKIVNIACGKPVKLINFISIIEKKLNKKSHKRFKNLQKGDVLRTAGSINKIKSIFGYQPMTPIEVGIGKFVKWYKQFYYKKYKK